MKNGAGLRDGIRAGRMPGMELKLAEQAVAVFGAARGIGRAVAEAFAAEGCRVRGFDREAAEGAFAGGQVCAKGDVTSYEEVRAFAAGAGAAEHMVYCVGAGSGKSGFPFWKLEPADWPRALAVNLLGAVNVAHAYAPALAARGRGTMLFLASVAGQTGSQTDPPYSAAKAALINFMQCAARDLAPHGVRVNALSPGMVRTALNEAVWRAGQETLPPAERSGYERWAEEKIRRVAPLGRWQTAEECAAMAVFLASEHARNITGQTLNIDGGQVMHA